jgi:2,4-dienoyl-CoA reductase (NADPH2)
VTTLILLRHGRSSANAAGVLAGRTPGIELDETGREQAARLVERLTGVPLAEVVCSPALRCAQTVAPLLAARGLEVAIVTGDGVVGTQLGRTGDLARANGRLQQAGVGCHPYSVIRSVGGDGAVLDDVHTGEQKVVPCAAIVDCGHRLSEDALSRRHPHTVRAGDCVAPRTVLEAIREGRAAALALDEQRNAVPLQLDREASPV